MGLANAPFSKGKGLLFPFLCSAAWNMEVVPEARRPRWETGPFLRDAGAESWKQPWLVMAGGAASTLTRRD